MNLQEQFLHFTTKSAELYFTQYLTEIEQKIELEAFQEQAQKALAEARSKDSTNWTLQTVQELSKNGLIKDYYAKYEFTNEDNERTVLELNDNNLLDFEFEDNDIIINGVKYQWEGGEEGLPTITNIADLFYELDIDFTIYVSPVRTDLKDNKKLLEDINDEMEDEDNEIVDAIAELKDRTKDITMLYWTTKDWYKEFYVLDLNNIK
ncbi:hypothetical protein ACNQ21_03505 [Mycoplasma sp. VS299A]|uniref:hypothetical protein n=1 Tax=Mycoplasma sp. VS299A TaxID=3401690 RepID=UPI003AAC1FE7